MRLNLGCGERMIDEPDWLNVDIRKICPDTALYLRHDIRKLRGAVVADDSADEILLLDVLEHFSRPEAEGILRDCFAMLKPGSVLHIKTPVIHLLISWAISHDHENTSFRWYGGNDYPENCHKYCWAEDALLRKLTEYGFEISGIKHQEDTNIVVEAMKPWAGSKS
jgi:predicted SAM-dependent methyltransferase